MWDPIVLRKRKVTSLENVLIIEGEWSFVNFKGNFKCFMVNVYTSQEDRRKKELWDFISCFMGMNKGLLHLWRF